MLHLDDDKNCSTCRNKSQCVAPLRDILSSKGGRFTRERVAILQASCKMTGHWTPEELASVLRSRGEPIATTTVYRNLALLEEAGIIRRAAVGASADAAQYEHAWGRTHHDHLVCAVCGRRVEFSYPAIEVLQEAVAREHGFTLRRHTLELVGTCPECREAGRS